MAGHKRRRYTPEEKERGLATLVIAGSSFRASEMTGIPDDTLRNWKRDNLAAYERLCEELEPRIKRTIAAEAEGIALVAAEKERDLLAALNADTIAALKPAEIAATLRNVSTSKALQIDKISSPLRERPSHVQPHASLPELMAQAARALGIVIDSTAVEIPNDEGPRNGGPPTPSFERRLDPG